MRDAPEEFAAMMQRVRTGCPEAAREVFDRFNPHVQRVVRRYLARRLRRQFDSLDFSQAVWASFFVIPADRYTFACPTDLLKFLGQIAANKVIEEFRHQLQTRKNDVGRELPIAQLPAGDAPVAAAAVAAEPAGREPTPSQVAIAEERWKLLLRNQPPLRQRVLELLRQGHSPGEASEQTGVHPKVIQRLLRKLSGGAELG
jgi:DNA-directed RNA polymerase specialized sigma24 family protein